MARVDAYENTAVDYDDIPDMADRDVAGGMHQTTGVPRIGRPPHGAGAKRQVTLRLDPDTLQRFKAGGPGWQVRMGRLLQRNEAVLAMIEREVAIVADGERLLAHIRDGGLRSAFEPVEAELARIERFIATARDTARDLRATLVLE